MTTKQSIQERLQNLTEEQLNQVYEMIETLENTAKKPSLMSELQQVSIDAPEDFSVQVAMRLERDVSED
ncbi:MAG: hypothetical protein AB4041_06595 [Microcystaceae cyanobacterium]